MTSKRTHIQSQKQMASTNLPNQIAFRWLRYPYLAPADLSTLEWKTNFKNHYSDEIFNLYYTHI